MRILSALIGVSFILATAHVPDCAAGEVPEKPRPTLAAHLKEQRYTAIPLIPTVDHAQYLAKVKLDGKPHTLLLDTGASAGIFLSKAAGKRLGIASDTLTSDKPGGNKITSNKMGVGTIERLSLTFGSEEYMIDQTHTVYVLEGLSDTAAVFNPKSGKDEPAEIDGMLGLEFLEAHCAIIDTETFTLFVIPFNRRELPKLQGRWECVSGEQYGKRV